MCAEVSPEVPLDEEVGCGVYLLRAQAPAVLEPYCFFLRYFWGVCLYFIVLVERWKKRAGYDIQQKSLAEDIAFTWHPL